MKVEGTEGKQEPTTKANITDYLDLLRNRRYLSCEEGPSFYEIQTREFQKIWESPAEVDAIWEGQGKDCFCRRKRDCSCCEK